jgi:UDP-N-acetylmuramyl pentapeptide phosphotransferase/UDP-N-acetylglucosamine-1-phosphate transferase
MMIALISALLASFLVTLWIVRFAKTHARFSHDHDVSGPQKFHARPVPRVGGVSVVAGVAVAILALVYKTTGAAEPVLLLGCGMPVFLMGVVEDLTKAVSPRRRLFAAALSALLAVMVLDGVIDRTDIPGIDWLVSFRFGAILLAVFVVAGFSNAINIIDGFNGLASMCVVIMLIVVAYVAFQVGDRAIALLSLAGIGAVLGFFIWNFPAGLIFLGDGGAYFLGFWLGELSILLVHRNPSVSPMFALLLGIYPVFETLFSIYRRRVLRGRPVGMPDGAHLHSLIYRRLLRWAAGERTARELTRRNSMTAPYLWMLCMLSAIPAALWWNNTLVLDAFILLFGFSYVSLYWKIVRFRTPRWFVLKRGAGVQARER